MLGGPCLAVWDAFKHLPFKTKNNLFVEPTTLHLLKLCDPKGTLKYQISGDRLSSILHFCSKLHADTLWLHGEWLRLDGSTIVKLSEIIGDIFI